MQEKQQRYMELQQALQNGQDALLATIIQSHGAVPCGTGAKMLLYGSTVRGTLGSETLDQAAKQQALPARRSSTKEFSPPLTATDIATDCGWAVTVYFQFYSKDDVYAQRAVSQIVTQYQEQEDSWLVTRILPGDYWESGVYCETTGLMGIGDIEVIDLLEHFHGQPAYDSDFGCFIEPMVQTGCGLPLDGGMFP